MHDNFPDPDRAAELDATPLHPQANSDVRIFAVTTALAEHIENHARANPETTLAEFSSAMAVVYARLIQRMMPTASRNRRRFLAVKSIERAIFAIEQTEASNN
jgi:hypothetical protein